MLIDLVAWYPGYFIPKLPHIQRGHMYIFTKEVYMYLKIKVTSQMFAL